MSKQIEQRLETARKARHGRLMDRLIPTVADMVLDALDALPDTQAQVEQIRLWANEKTNGNLAVTLRQGVAQGWLAGPKEDKPKARGAA